MAGVDLGGGNESWNVFKLLFDGGASIRHEGIEFLNSILPRTSSGIF